MAQLTALPLRRVLRNIIKKNMAFACVRKVVCVGTIGATEELEVGRLLFYVLGCIRFKS